MLVVAVDSNIVRFVCDGLSMKVMKFGLEQYCLLLCIRCG